MNCDTLDRAVVALKTQGLIRIQPFTAKNQQEGERLWLAGLAAKGADEASNGN